MTKINKIVMQGFKSFAKRTEIIFTENFNCIIGPNGAGKCIVGDSMVYLADGSVVRIRDLVEEKLKENPTTQVDDGFIAKGDQTKILCLDSGTLRVAKKQVAAFVKRTSPEELVSITTRSGRTITSTAYHPLFILDGEKIRSIEAENLREGLRVAVPRAIPSGKSGSFYGLIDEIAPQDGIYVPFAVEYVAVLKKIKKGTYKELAARLGIPYSAIKGLLDGQAINFAYLTKMMRFAGLDDSEIASRIPLCKSKTSSITCRIPWKNSPRLSRMLGYLLAEGRLTGAAQVWLTNGSPEVVLDYAGIVESVFGVHTTINEYKPNCWDVISYSRPMQLILNKLGMSFTGTKDKTISNLFLKSCGEDDAAELLGGLYSGDGYVSDSTVEITTKSANLSRGIGVLLAKFGILHHSKEVIKTATNSGYTGRYRQITVSGVENLRIFAERIELIHPKKQMRVLAILGKEANPNLDLVETNRLVKKVATELRINIKKEKKRFPRLDSYAYNQCIPSRYGVNHLIENLFTKHAEAQGKPGLASLQVLNLIAKSDIYWDEVVDIEKFSSNDQWVYDLCVEKDHNFIADNIFVHNSNVLDALCFVLGKSSVKGLRAEKSSNLIYNGGKSKKPAKEGEVSIYFDNSKKIFPTEDEVVKITRIIMQNGQGKYKINDQLRTRQQILDLLAVAKIDPDGYNIILQGDIVRFVEMSTADRRLIIEEIAGIGVYEDKKQKALKELENVDKRLGEAEIILKERQTHLKELKQDRDQALKYKDLNNRITQNQASYLKIQMNKKEDEKKKLQAEHDKHKGEFDRKQDKIKHSKGEIESRQNQIGELTREVEEKGEKEQIQVQKEIEQARVDMATAKTRVDSIETEIGRINQRRELLNKNLGEIEQKIKEFGESKRELEKGKKKNEGELNVIQGKITAFKDKHKIGQETSSIDQEMEKIDRESEEIQKELQRLREEQQELIRKKDRIEYQIQTLEGQIEKVKEIEKEHKKELDEIKEKRNTFQQVVKELNRLLEESSSTARAIRESETELFSQREKLEKLNLQQTRVVERKTGSLAVKKILEERKQFGKIYGTVAELGKVKAKYHQALEVAAGPRINNIVVDSDAIAERCINYLRSNKLGIATFLPLNKMRSPVVDANVERLKKEKGVHGLAIELISFEPRFEKVFSYVFGNTIIVEDIATARRIGIGNARMVTLNGDVVELSGAMQGGFREKKTATFQEEDVSDDIGRVETAIAKLQGAVTGLRTEQEIRDKTISTLREQRATLEGEIIKAEKSLHLRSDDLQASRQYKEELAKEGTEVNKKIAAFVDSITEKTKKLTELKMSKMKLKEKINQLRSPTLLAELAAFEQKQREIQDMNSGIDAQIKGIEMQIADILVRDRDNTTKILKEMDKEEVQFKKEMENLRGRVKEYASLLKEKEAVQAKYFARFKEVYAKRNKLTEEIKEFDKQVDELAEQSRKEDYAVNTASLELATVKAELAGMEQEYLQYEGVPVDLAKPEQELKKEIKEFEKLREDIGSVNLRALDVYEAVEREYNSLVEKKETLLKEKEDVNTMMNEIESRKKDLFMKNFDYINNNFKSIFSMLSAKGEAYLELENPENPFEQGVEIKVRITGNKFLDIRSLSGGEKTLTALAFIFSIQEYEPASFYILDEVDAALDKHNSEKLAKLIAKYGEKAQYIMISHNDSVISEAGSLYGVHMDEHGVSNVVSLRI